MQKNTLKLPFKKRKIHSKYATETVSFRKKEDAEASSDRCC